MRFGRIFSCTTGFSPRRDVCYHLSAEDSLNPLKLNCSASPQPRLYVKLFPHQSGLRGGLDKTRDLLPALVEIPAPAITTIFFFLEVISIRLCRLDSSDKSRKRGSI